MDKIIKLVLALVLFCGTLMPADMAALCGNDARWLAPQLVQHESNNERPGVIDLYQSLQPREELDLRKAAYVYFGVLFLSVSALTFAGLTVYTVAAVLALFAGATLFVLLKGKERWEEFHVRLVWRDRYWNTMEAVVEARRLLPLVYKDYGVMDALNAGMEVLNGPDGAEINSNCFAAALMKVFPQFGFTVGDHVKGHTMEDVLLMLCLQKREVWLDENETLDEAGLGVNDIVLFYNEFRVVAHAAVVVGFDQKGRPLLYQKAGQECYCQGTLAQTIKLYKDMRVTRIKVFAPRQNQFFITPADRAA